MMTLGEITQSEFQLLGAVSDEELLMALEGATEEMEWILLEEKMLSLY